MAITFTQERKKQKYLILVLALITLAIVLVVWLGFFKRGETPLPSLVPIVSQKKIEIGWETLRNPLLKELQVFEEISPLEGEVGRENPFTPY